MKSIVIGMCALLSIGCGMLSRDAAQEKHLLIKKSRSAEIGVLTNAGGRIVLLRAPGGENLMRSDALEWGREPPKPPEGAVKKEYREYGGNIVWTGPQSRWWQEQTILPAKRKLKGKWPWPPDPFLTFGAFTVITNGKDVLSLQGGVSPVSGVALVKEITLGQHLRLRTTASNVRSGPIERDLWTATMLSADARVYVPVADHRSVRFMSRTVRTNIVWDIMGDMLVAAVRQYRTNAFIESDKAFIAPREGYAAVAAGRWVWLMLFTLPAAGSVSPEHGAVEISAEAKESRAASGFTLSRHSALSAIPPAGTISWSEDWHILQYTGAATDADRIAFIERSAARIIEERTVSGVPR